MTAIDARRAELAEDCARMREALDGPKCVSTLCPQERAVLKMVGMGMTDKEIMAALRITKNTAHSYMQRLHDKTAIPYRARLAVAAYRVCEADRILP